MEHDIPFGNSNRENGTTFLDFPLFLGIFQWDEPTKRVPFTSEPEIPEILTKWKAPPDYQIPCGTNFRGSLILRTGDFLCFVGTNYCDWDKSVFLAGN